MLYMQIYNHKY